MRLDEKLYKAFLEEMQDLEAFRMAYAAAHPKAGLDRDDPDVKRLMEAIAFFSARTRLASRRHIEASHRRLFSQLVPYLLSPLPAMGLLKAVPTGQFPESVLLPRGAELALSAESGHTALFRTRAELRILPLEIGRVDLMPLPRGGMRLVIPLLVPYPRNDEIGTLTIHVNHLNDYLASLLVFESLRRHLVRSSVVFEERVDESSKGPSCEVSFGLAEPAAGSEEDEAPHPLERERIYFFFPQAQLFFDVRVPQPPRNWSRLAICLDLDGRWPKDLRLSRDVFSLFVVPMINLQSGTAAPIICDGTQERFAIRHPAAAARFALHSVRAVSQVEEGTLVPLFAGTLASGSGTYEVAEEVDAEGTKRPWLHLHMPEAFGQPRTVSVEALWHQPWFSAMVGRKLQVAPYRRALYGVRWELVGDLVPYMESGFGDDIEAFLHLFVLQNKTALTRDDLDTLLQTLTSVWKGPFGALRDHLRAVRVEELPMKGDGSSGTLKLVYQLTFDESVQGMEPLVNAFVLHVARILDAWISEGVVEVRTEIAT